MLMSILSLKACRDGYIMIAIGCHILVHNCLSIDNGCHHGLGELWAQISFILIGQVRSVYPMTIVTVWDRWWDSILNASLGHAVQHVRVIWVEERCTCGWDCWWYLVTGSIILSIQT